MTRLANQLLGEAMQLSEHERADLAARLIDSLDSTVDADSEPAWSEEVQQRLKDIQEGKVRPIPWEEARRMILEDNDESPAP
jgi:putative addiction module component (TIGR02574 family)